jgi:drug/metabolite transporter (DMT)-like permease
MIADRPIIGIAFILGFCLFAPMSDAAAKSIALTTPLLVLLLARYVAQWLLPLPLILSSERSLEMTPKIARIILARSVVHIAGVAVMFSAYRYLPLADALAIAFVFPFIMLVMGKFFLGEQVGVRRLGACTVGFFGTLLIIQPSFATVGSAALLPLLVAFLFALLVLLTRQIAKDYDPVCLQSASGLVSTVILFAAWAATRHLQVFDLQIIMPTTGQAQTLVLIGVFGTLAHLAMTYAVRFAPSTTLAPMQYVELPIATALGWMIFSEFPNGIAAIGILITILCGLAVIYFEHQALGRTARD